MATCPECGRDASTPDYERKQVRPSGASGGRIVTGTSSRWYWVVCCPHCDVVLGTVGDR